MKGFAIWFFGVLVGVLIAAAASSPIWLPMVRDQVDVDVPDAQVQIITWDGRVLPNRLDTLLFLAQSDVVATIDIVVDDGLPIGATLQHVDWQIDINQDRSVAVGRTPAEGSLDIEIAPMDETAFELVLQTPAYPLYNYVDEMIRMQQTTFAVRGEITIQVLGVTTAIPFETPHYPVRL